MLARIRVHRVYENGEVEMHFEEITAEEWPRVDFDRDARYFSSDQKDEARLEIGEALAFSVPDSMSLLTMYVDTTFGFAGGNFDSETAVAEAMAKHVLTCSRDCEHASHTTLAAI